MNETRDSGHHIAMATAIRVVAIEPAKIINPADPESAFLALGQEAFDTIDRISNPALDEPTTKAVKNAAYDTLRMVFEPKPIKPKRREDP